MNYRKTKKDIYANLSKKSLQADSSKNNSHNKSNISDEKKSLSAKEYKVDSIMKRNWKPGNMLYPIPAVMVSCCDKDAGNTNILTVAWTGTVCSDPPMVFISVRPERYSYDMIKNSGEFVINLVTEKLVHASDWCGVRSGKDFDKWRECNLSQYKSEFMQTPAIKESPVNIYCKVENIIPLGSHDMFLAKVVGITVNDEYFDENGGFHLNKTGLITYVHGEYYALGNKLGSFGYSVRKKEAGKRRRNGRDR